MIEVVHAGQEHLRSWRGLTLQKVGVPNGWQLVDLVLQQLTPVSLLSVLPALHDELSRLEVEIPFREGARPLIKHGKNGWCFVLEELIRVHLNFKKLSSNFQVITWLMRHWKVLLRRERIVLVPGWEVGVHRRICPRWLTDELPIMLFSMLLSFRARSLSWDQRLRDRSHRLRLLLRAKRQFEIASPNVGVALLDSGLVLFLIPKWSDGRSWYCCRTSGETIRYWRQGYCRSSVGLGHWLPDAGTWLIYSAQYWHNVLHGRGGIDHRLSTIVISLDSNEKKISYLCWHRRHRDWKNGLGRLLSWLLGLLVVWNILGCYKKSNWTYLWQLSLGVSSSFLSWVA